MSDWQPPTQLPQEPRGRYAPSPTGYLHVGCARTALAAWLSIRRQGGTFVWRVEDLDPPRTVEGTAEAAMEDLAWLGLDWDEGPEAGGSGAGGTDAGGLDAEGRDADGSEAADPYGTNGPYGPYKQSQRSTLYESALQHLYDGGRIFPCSYSRKDVRELASAPHGSGGQPPYPASLRPAALEAGWFDAFGRGEGPDAALRFRIADHAVTFEDRMQGEVTERVSETVGDFVLKRRDGLYAYQLAVVVDDLLMQVTEVVRGTDLLDSTARQLQLIDALGGRRPAYAHIPLVVRHNGDKLSKRNDDIKLSALRNRGAASEALCGYLGYSLGLLEAPRRCTPHDLIPRFDWAAIPDEPWPLPDDIERVLLDV